MTIDRREFFKKTTIAAITTASVVKEAQSQIIKEAAKVETDGYGFYKKGKWRNWSKQVNVKPKEIFKPKNLNEMRWNHVSQIIHFNGSFKT